MQSVVFLVCSVDGLGCFRVMSSGKLSARKTAARHSSASSGLSAAPAVVVVM